MPALWNVFHERICQEFAPGKKTQKAAVAIACEEFERKLPSAPNIRRIFGYKTVKARIAEIRALAQRQSVGEELAAIDAARTAVEMSRLVVADATKAYERAGKGYRMRDLESLPASLTAAISAIDTNANGDPVPRFYNKIAAANILSKLLGVTEKIEISDKLDVSDLSSLSDEQLSTLEAIIRTAAAARSDHGGSRPPSAPAVRGTSQSEPRRT